MTMLAALMRELAGLFVDDGSLALAIAGVVMIAAISAVLMPNLPMAAGAVLLFGCLGVLFGNVIKAR